VFLSIALAIAVAAVLLLFAHVARRYRDAPARVPLHVAYDGRPYRYGPRALLWLTPAILACVVAAVGVACVTQPPRAQQQPVIGMVFLVVAEVAWLVGWLVDRQIELARQMTFRIAPSRLVLVVLPVIGTMAVTLAVAAMNA